QQRKRARDARSQKRRKQKGHRKVRRAVWKKPRRSSLPRDGNERFRGPALPHREELCSGSRHQDPRNQTRKPLTCPEALPTSWQQDAETASDRARPWGVQGAKQE